MTDAFALELEGVSRSFGVAAVVRDVSLSVARGEYFALLGPSGCGKTTLLRLVAGFLAPDAGEIRIAGVRANEALPHERDVNLVFQNYALFPHLTVARNVAFGLEMQGVGRRERKERVTEGLAMVRLEEFASRRPRQLSGGQQQRVALARALVTRPAVVLLDEPLAALDQKLRLEMRVELRRLQRRTGTTFVHVTHDQEEALELADRVAVMRAGRVAQVGTPAEIYDAPATRFVADFIGGTNFLEGQVIIAAAEGSVVRIEALGTEATVPPGAAPRKPGDPVLLSFRPERIALATDGSGVPATVRETAFAGRDTRYRVSLAGGEELDVRAPGGPRAGEGEAVSLSWEPGALTVVEEDRDA
jgi:ABC-type Fe3+/spermidine/putrescine transport system ATPase subunit